MRSLLLIFLFSLWSLAFADLTYTTYHNLRFAYSIDYPKNLLFPQGEAENGDGQKFLSKNTDATLLVFGSNNALNQTLEERYHEESRGGTPDTPKRVVTYRVQKDNWYVISGYNDGKVFYQKTIYRDDVFKTFYFEYDENRKSFYDPIVKQLAKSFTG
jgi:hypothetical protein